jgi:hypothetical protein
MWLVILKAAKDQILGVDTLGQYVSPRVQYGMAYLLIRDDVGSVHCYGIVTTIAKPGIRPIINLCNDM